jgi:hypothetical protein
MRHGFVRIPSCFSRAKAAQWTADVWTRLGYSPNNQSTWAAELTHMPDHKNEPVMTFAPKAWAAMCELLGGENRMMPWSATWNDAFIVNLGTAESEGQVPKPTELNGWHVDGDFFTHFLDSPEQGLLVIPLFSDIQEHAGGTMVCSDSIKVVARYLVSELTTDPFLFSNSIDSMIIPKACLRTWFPEAAARTPTNWTSMILSSKTVTSSMK